MKVCNVNSSLLKKMVINGAINLKNNYKEVDQLNVFPVPDGDTGTNMQMTMMAGVREISNFETNSIVELSKTLSRGLLMGARGNSGVILSQFFRGVYLGMKEINGSEATINEFVNCLVSGYKVAYKAVMDPVEGTILTVVREAAEEVLKNVDNYDSINTLIDSYLSYALISLKNTPNLLPVLKEAGVVDSGGTGFIKVIEGMKLALEGIILEADTATDNAGSTVMANFSTDDIKFGYCTEFIIELRDESTFQEIDLKSQLSLIGDSLVVVKDEDIVKVHVHTNTPGDALNLAQRYGEFVSLKVENMRIQHSNLVTYNDEAKQEVTEMPRKKYGIIAVCFGDGVKKTFSDFGVDYIIDGGQTMNPPTEEFVKAVKAINAEHIIIIPNNSNVILSAEQTIKICEDQDIRVLKAKTIAHGYASLMVFDSTNDIDQNISDMQEAINNVKAGEVTFAVRDTEIKGVKIKAGDYIGITNGSIVVSTELRLDATKHLLSDCITDESVVVTFFYGQNIDPVEIDELEKYCYELNEDVEVAIIDGNQDIYSYIIAVE